MLSWEIKFFSELSALRLYQVLKLRQDVFVLEQQCLYADTDNLDQQALHFLLMSEEDDDLVAYCRVLPADTSYPEVSIGRVVVAPNARNKGFAKQLMQKAIHFIEDEMQASAIKISAQSHLQNFYQSLGFIICSSPYDEDGIEHVEMTLINTQLS
ncbi:GNAT family N-acetyltransferase [Psychromonas sp. SR45-3]|uniref:GNAT family N-acetyltransferase n=1 Tax=Psychromonas sp. SR45-3 TaxID=2760930 RepID=UPI0015FA55A8|nr:GNAT family N-acetyltransferase [Psychromonas sp. SR45-3]MBB1272348.1 GNAT family N-acetyltransferase [Psychromonas sp. SR45-3]